MKHSEILAPAGSPEALQAALAAGADAVYFALPKFGARAYAANFDLDQTREAIAACHLAGAKAYITMNTLLKEDEMEEAYEQAKALYEIGADALIVQDLGLMHLLHHRLPELELHASTQVSINRPEQIEKLKKLGVTRVVLARECTKEQIAACKQAGLEIEVFVHGALCISWSGQCQFSAVRYGRSGNRGACAQPCRMEYTLLEDGRPVQTEGDYLLSPKDLSVLPEVRELEALGVDSLKIEGRMKSPEYVYTTVRKTAKAQEGKKLDAEDLRQLRVTFNRGYTTGHVENQRGAALMNPGAPNHRGIEIGTVVAKRGKEVEVRLSQPLLQGDGLRFGEGKNAVGFHANFIYQGKNHALVREGRPGQIVGLEPPRPVKPGTKVYKTVDAALKTETENAVRDSQRQIPVAASFTAPAAGEKACLTLTYQNHRVQVASAEPIVAASKRAADEESVRRQLEKTGGTFARFALLQIELGNDLFLPVSVLNQMRREALDQLKEKILASRVAKERPYAYQPEPTSVPAEIVDLRSARLQVPEGVVAISEWPLKGVRRKAGLQETEGYVVSHLGEGSIVADMNITNSWALAALLEMGYEGALVSREVNDEELEKLLKGFKARYGFAAPLLKNVYGKERLMIMNHCPVNTALKDGQRRNCALCHTKRYELEGLDGRRVLLEGDPACRMNLYEDEVYDVLDRVPFYRELGVPGFWLSFIDESPEKQAEVLAGLAVREKRGILSEQTR